MKKRKRKSREEQYRPVREIVRESFYLQVGEIQQEGEGAHPAAWESPYERRLIYLFLMCEDITTIETQPTEWVYQVDGDTRRHYPDARLLTTSGERYLEVKPLKRLIKPGILEKYLLIAQSFIAAQKHYVILSDDQINSRWYENAFLLSRYRTRTVSEALTRTVLDACASAPVTIAQILERATETSVADIYALLAKRTLAFDWEQPLSRQSLVSLPTQPFRGMTYERIRSSGRFADLLAEVALGRRPSDQRLLAAKRARRRPLAPSSATGFVGVLSAQQLGGLKRELSKRAAHEARHRTSGAPADDRTNAADAKEA